MNDTANIYEPKEQPETADAYCDQLIADGLTYSVQFVPWNQSRNRDDKTPSLNWLVTIGRAGRGSLTTDYMQGIGHAPGYKPLQRVTVDIQNQWEAIANTGRNRHGKAKLPKLRDVLYSLVSDSDVLEHSCFDDWADCYGYDTDSREAERIYRACLDIALQLRQLIDLNEAREAFEDY